MTAVIAYTLPAMQLVCHLVVSGPSGINVTEPVSYTTQPPPQNKIYTPLPAGYVAKPGLGFAYKYHGERLTWIQARNVCVQEGAQLAVIDTAEKMKYIDSLELFSYVHAGIFRIRNDTWINVNTGEPVSSKLWRSDEPRNGRDCAEFIHNPFGGLASFPYNDSEVFFCEIPILVNSTINLN